jgi:hypothetical protein
MQVYGTVTAIFSEKSRGSAKLMPVYVRQSRATLPEKSCGSAKLMQVHGIVMQFT